MISIHSFFIFSSSYFTLDLWIVLLLGYRIRIACSRWLSLIFNTPVFRPLICVLSLGERSVSAYVTMMSGLVCLGATD